MSNIQKLFSERIEIFSAVEFSKVSVLTGIIKISLKVCSFGVRYLEYLKQLTGACHFLFVAPVDIP